MNTFRVDVGTPPEKFEGWTTINVCFHGFADLTTTREEYVESSKFSCFGHQWRLDIYPGGDNGSLEGYVAVDLCNMSSSSIKIQHGYSVRDLDGKEVVHKEPNITDEFAPCARGNDNAVSFSNFAKRSAIKELLVQGTLVIEVRMKLPSTGNNVTQFIPTNPINKNVLELFNEEETADVVFEVGGEHQTAKGKSKRAKTSATNFYAHRNILQKCAPTLYEMCKSDEGITTTTVSITDVKPEIFKHMIYYTYGGKLLAEELNENAKDIINACDKYGVVHLKLEVEACYVKSNEITMDNMMDNLLYADSKNLALLKEAVMDFILANKHSIIGKVSFDNIPGFATDLLTAMARGEEQTGDEEEDESIKYNRMRVRTLRKMLDEKGLDVDGSREAMIALLKEHDNSNDDDNDD